MKKVFAIILSLSILFAYAAFAAPILTFQSLRELQNYIYNNSPDLVSSRGSPHVEMEGVISDIHWSGHQNQYFMTVQIQEEKAAKPFYSDSPEILIIFHLHVDPIPFNVGEEIYFSGVLNGMYSSPIIPCVNATTLNGSDDF